MAISIGDRVKLTPKFKRSTGQTDSTVWTVLGFERDWAIVSEPVLPGIFTPEEISAQPDLAFRRIALSNLTGAK